MPLFDLGVLGGGQLARMSIQAAQRMGLRCLALDPDPECCTSKLAPVIAGRLDDPEAIARLVGQSDRITLENEFIPAWAIAEAFALAGAEPQRLMPGWDVLATVQDKLLQRQAYARYGAPTPRAVPLEGDGSEAIEAIGFPMVLKARFGGYDGKGTRYARTPVEFEALRPQWQDGWLAEAFVPFRRELAAMVYRSPHVCGAFPTVETVQTNHVCDLVYPSGVDASEVAIAAVEAVGGYGLFGVEMFELGDGSVLINEIAPRPHNTGHYTLDWGGVSQFEMHVRLAMGLPLTEPVGGDTCMANLLGPPGDGDLRSALTGALEVPGSHVHWYGKAYRAGRKLGHINAVGAGCVDRAVAARSRFWDAWAR